MKIASLTRNLKLGSFAFIALVIAACSGPLQSSVENLVIDGGDRQINVGDEVQLEATVTTRGNASTDVTWSSNSDDVVSVDADGLITGVAEGSADITATSVEDPSVTDTITVTVAAAGPTVSDVTIEGGDRALNVGDTQQLDVTVAATGGASTDVTWSSSAPGTVSVDGDGLITAEAEGTADITATSVEDPSVEDTVTVTVLPAGSAVASVEIDGGDRGIEVGETEQLAATVVATGGASTEVTWSTSSAGTVSVDANGLITGEAQGSADITATSVEDPSVSDTITVTVAAPGATVDDVTIDGGDRTLTLWEDLQLNATVETTGGASTAVNWSSSDDGIVSVDDGLITAHTADASATITATSVADGSVSDAIEVTVDALPAADSSELYVDASVPSGGNGHQDFPFAAITDGVDAVDAGGTVNVLAGTYQESVFIDKSLELLGAGVGSVTIVSNEDAGGQFSENAIDIRSVDGLVLSGFRLEVEAPGPTGGAIGMMYANGSSNVLIEDVEIEHTNDARTSRGIGIRNSDAVTLRNVSIQAVAVGGDTGHAGAGVEVTGSSTNVELDNVDTSGHESYAGVALIPAGLTIDGVTISNDSTFDEINEMTVGSPSGGTVTNLSAPQFEVAVGNVSSAYGGGTRYFYKTDTDRAILDSLFNFNEVGSDGREAWVHSTVQTLDPTDQSIRENEFVLGSVLDTEYGFGIERSSFVQAAVNAADSGATLNLRAGTYAGADEAAFGGEEIGGEVVIDVDNLTIQGDAAASVLATGVGSGPVLTIDANGVTINDVTIDGEALETGILVGTGDNLTVDASNLLTDVALDNTANAAVVAENNWWGAADGPSGDGAGSGNQLDDPTAGVDYEPFAGTAY